MTSVYQTCALEHGDDMPGLIQCVSNWAETNAKDVSVNSPGFVASDFVSVHDITNWLLVLTGSLIFFMQAGFAMVCAGAIRKKNVKNTMLKNLLDACGAGLAFYSIGYGLSYGHSGDPTESTFIGNSNFFLMDDQNPAAFFFQYAFSATCVTIIAGTLAERCQMAAYFAYSMYLTGFVYPVVVHNIWSAQGYFSTGNANALVGIGMVDFAGSGVVHMTGGSTALYATIILGARQGRFHDRNGNELAKPGLTKGHSVALQMLGTFILFFGWFGFNPGSALALSVENKGQVAAIAAVTTTLSAAAGTVSCMMAKSMIDRFHFKEFTLDITFAMNGCLSGLVAITSGCAVVEPWAAILIGTIAGWVYIGADVLLIKNKLDDAVAAIQVHLACGFWGVIAAGLFASPSRMLDAYGTDSHPGFFYAPGGDNLLPAQLAGALFIIGWTLVSTLPFFSLLDYFNLFRVNALEEIIGLDANYQNFVDGPHIGEEPSDDEDEELRVAAYRQRFAERKKATDKIKTVEEMFNESWGASEVVSEAISNVSEAVAKVTDAVTEGANSVVIGVRDVSYKQWKKLQMGGAVSATGGDSCASTIAMSEQAPPPLSATNQLNKVLFSV